MNEHESAQSCGCDKGANWVCEKHTAEFAKKMNVILDNKRVITGGYVVKDSGERKTFDSGMVRDVTTDKIDFSLAMDGPMFERLAIHLTKGAKKYAKRNWMQAAGPEEMDRFRESALRHFIQWMRGDVDEDHAAAVLFNINGYEYTKGKQ